MKDIFAKLRYIIEKLIFKLDINLMLNINYIIYKNYLLKDWNWTKLVFNPICNDHNIKLNKWEYNIILTYLLQTKFINFLVTNSNTILYLKMCKTIGGVMDFKIREFITSAVSFEFVISVRETNTVHIHIQGFL